MRGEPGISARKRGAAVRAFFALPLPAAQAEPVAGLAEALRARADGEAVRWVAPDGLHVTLRFLGNVPTERIAEVVEEARGRLAGCGPFALELGGPEPFPAPRRPRVVVLGCSPADPIAELAERLEAGAVALGFPPERRTFRAHLTLGRLRNRRMPSLAPQGLPSPPGEWLVDRVVLFKSELTHDGPRYAALETIPLEHAASAAPERSPLISNETERG